MLAIARWTQPDYVERARSSGRAQLLTIPYSHYVELARWTMEVQNQFVEFMECSDYLSHIYYTTTTQLFHNYYTTIHTHSHNFEAGG